MKNHITKTLSKLTGSRNDGITTGTSAYVNVFRNTSQYRAFNA